MAIEQRVGPSRRIRYTGRAINAVATRAPWAWPLVGRVVRRFFDAAAAGWDERIQPDSGEHLVGIERGLESVDSDPATALDIGTGTGSAALMLARRYPAADVLGIDLAERMIAAARVKSEREGLRARFEVADIGKLSAPAGFDLITMLNMPPFFDRVSALLAPGGHVIHVSSAGDRTPFYTSERELRRGFGKRGLTTVAAGVAGASTYYVARRPD